jgi:FG-GAP-like repeat/Divergent InlB B-repeat domain
VSVFLGNGDGTFQDPTNYAAGLGFSVIAADFNGDLKIDLAVPNPVEVSLLLGNGDGTFQRERDYPVAPGFPLYAVGDFNADGRPDLVAADGAVLSVPLNIADMPIFTLAVTESGSGAGTVTTNPGWVTCNSDCSRKFAQGTAVSLAAHSNPGSSFTGWSGGGCSGTGTCSLALTSDQTVTATFDLTPDFALSVSDFTPNPIGPGQSSTATVTAGAIGGFGGAVSVTCSVQPSPSHAPNCSVSPNSITPGNTATVTITTTAPSAAQALPSGSASDIFYAVWLPVAGLALAGVSFRSRAQTKVKAWGFLFCVVLVAGLVFQSACGGGGSPGDGGGGTPTGSYTITINGTSGSLHHSTTVTIRVQ